MPLYSVTIRQTTDYFAEVEAETGEAAAALVEAELAQSTVDDLARDNEVAGEEIVVNGLLAEAVRPAWVVRRSPHQHEAWQLDVNATTGGLYCKACGGDVPATVALP